MNKRPQTFSDQYCIEDAGVFPRLKRNLRLLGFLFKTFIKWFQARGMRAEFKQARETEQPFYVDRFGPPK